MLKAYKMLLKYMVDNMVNDMVSMEECVPPTMNIKEYHMYNNYIYVLRWLSR